MADIIMKKDHAIDIHTDEFHIRSVLPEDKTDFMSLRSKTSDVAVAYDIIPDFLDFSWKKTLESKEDISMIVFRNKDNIFVAICSFQDFVGDTIELGFDVVESLRGQGIGTALVRELVALAHQVFPGKEVIIRTHKDNIASQRVAEKCGGVLISRECTPAARILAKGMEMIGDFSEDEKNEMNQIIEDGQEGIYVYRMP